MVVVLVVRAKVCLMFAGFCGGAWLQGKGREAGSRWKVAEVAEVGLQILRKDCTCSRYWSEKTVVPKLPL